MGKERKGEAGREGAEGQSANQVRLETLQWRMSMKVRAKGMVARGGVGGGTVSALAGPSAGGGKRGSSGLSRGWERKREKERQGEEMRGEGEREEGRSSRERRREMTECHCGEAHPGS